MSKFTTEERTLSCDKLDNPYLETESCPGNSGKAHLSRNAGSELRSSTELRDFTQVKVAASWGDFMFLPCLLQLAHQQIGDQRLSGCEFSSYLVFR